MKLWCPDMNRALFWKELKSLPSYYCLCYLPAPSAADRPLQAAVGASRRHSAGPCVLPARRLTEMLIGSFSRGTKCNTYVRKSGWTLFQISIHPGEDVYFLVKKWPWLIPGYLVLAFPRTGFGCQTGQKWLTPLQWTRRQGCNRYSYFLFLMLSQRWYNTSTKKVASLHCGDKRKKQRKQAVFSSTNYSLGINYSLLWVLSQNKMLRTGTT